MLVMESGDPESEVILKEGWCIKGGMNNRNWMKRWVVLTPLQISWFKNKNAVSPAGVWEVANVIHCNILPTAKDPWRHRLMWSLAIVRTRVTPSSQCIREILFRADSPESRQEWTEAISLAVAKSPRSFVLRHIPWTLERHDRFDKPFREAVLTLLMIWNQSWKPLLDKNVLYLIISYLAAFSSGLQVRMSDFELVSVKSSILRFDSTLLTVRAKISHEDSVEDSAHLSIELEESRMLTLTPCDDDSEI